ncbi:hypothetical protein D3C76_1422360 [compost metagenome]
MRPEGGADTGVIGLQVLAHGGFWQRHRVFLLTRQAGKQTQLLLYPGHFPACPVAVAGQATQRAGIGQLLLGAGIESRPFAEVGNVGKRPFGACRLDASGIVLAKALDHA